MVFLQTVLYIPYQQLTPAESKFVSDSEIKNAKNSKESDTNIEFLPTESISQCNQSQISITNNVLMDYLQPTAAYLKILQTICQRKRP